MNRADRIERILSQAFAPSQLAISDDSAKHAGHAGARPGGQTHYSIRIVSDAFAGKTKVQAHQMVYVALAEEFKTGLHALAID
ncbi:MAG: BolA family protein, partial [Alphaproteobacteria bacterium]